MASVSGAHSDRWPDFFIVGAAKAGTTSLWRYLEQHPDIFMPRRFINKEPSYFSDIYGMTDLERYLALFADASEQQTLGEASTAYLTDPSSAGRIRDAVPSARIVIMLRNPVDRAYSLYNWMTQEGYDFAPSFKDALEREPARAASLPARWGDAYPYNYLYLKSGCYYDQLIRYLREFPKEHVGVWLFEELVTDPEAVYREVCRFIGVSDSYSPDFKAHNVTHAPLYPPLQFVLRKLNDALTRLRRAVGRPPRTKEERDWLVQLGMQEGRPRSLASGCKRRLLENCRDDIRRLEKLLDRDLSHWFDE